MKTRNLLYYLDEYVLEDGIQRFQFPKQQTFVCSIEKPHLVKTSIIFLSDKAKGAFIFCRKHNDFFDVLFDEGKDRR
jgi:hypothetical protein